MVNAWKYPGLLLIGMLALGMAFVIAPQSVWADSPTDNVTISGPQNVCDNHNDGGVIESNNSYVLIDVDCWHSGHCVVCDEDSDYSCSPSNYCWVSNCHFADPLQAGDIVTGIEAEVRAVPCNEGSPTSALIQVYVNNTLVGQGTEIGDCDCDECYPLFVVSDTYEFGFPNYVYSGLNDLHLVVDGEICLSNVHVKLYYRRLATGEKLNVSPSAPTTFNPPQLSIQYLNVYPNQTASGQPVTITTNVVNTGDQAGSLNVALKINGQLEQSKVVSVGPQATQPVKFTVTRMQPGSYAVDIADQTSSFTIVGKTDNAPTVPNSTLIVLATMGIVATILAAMIILSYRRKT